ncbi:MAG TPA: hypothetical protein VKM55_30875 [Candidatus Lokiarchaeia archaeon]|nr:hypothetical protein [Candidatus Lokiarchaeia archaeon]
MPSLRELMIQKQQEEAAKQAEAAKVKQASEVKPAAKPAPKPRATKPRVAIQKALPGLETSSQVSDHGITKEITIDTLRGLYWMATSEHIGDKKTPRGPLKQKLNELLLTKEGMRQFLNSLEQFVFS